MGRTRKAVIVALQWRQSPLFVLVLLPLFCVWSRDIPSNITTSDIRYAHPPYPCLRET
ncbi:hypothetical protein Hsero_3229 [Herbaspirillum seropedicae SmR1]|uniref:Uncharacterized protein n=1 Tax=Herbaspirillum seropedicae (strain SmR1) TaxID=757424 RepID=D8J1E1_HERSS|nr:hypothetical protein Hsero_3229 [Herbaspirillum seropedicae SmR1]